MPAAAAAAATAPLSPFFTPELVACRLYLCNTGCAWVDYGTGCSKPPVTEEELVGKIASRHARYHLDSGYRMGAVIDAVQTINTSQSFEATHEENRCCCPRDDTDLAMQQALCKWCSDDADPPECGYACAADEGRRARQAQCEASELWLQKHHGDNAVLQSQSGAERSPRLDFEQEATSDVDWSLLPKSGHLADNIGLNGAWRSCAIVGSSSSLLGHGNGKLIDSHDQVIRINVPVLSGFESDVGNRTTVQMFWGDFGESIPHFDEAQAVLSPADRAVAVQAPSTKRDIDNHFAALRAGRKMPAKQPLYMLSGHSYHRALRWLCEASGGGRVWHNRIPRIRPSTGFYAVAFALDNCNSTSLFGFGDAPPCAPHHYWDAPPPNSTCNASAASTVHLGQAEVEEELQRDGVAANHWFDLEHRIYSSLREQERLKMEEFTNQRLLTPLSWLRTEAGGELGRL